MADKPKGLSSGIKQSKAQFYQLFSFRTAYGSREKWSSSIQKVVVYSYVGLCSMAFIQRPKQSTPARAKIQ